jgi:hypothetical protein
LVREIPLEVVLTSWGAVRDQRDKSRWQTPRGPLSVTGAKFHGWHARQGGGGAIDLVMYLGGWSARQAIEWLWRHHGCQLAGASRATAAASGFTSSSPDSAPAERDTNQRGSPALLRLPTSSPANLPRVHRYLTQQRGLSTTIVSSLIDEGKLYADSRGNAVFLMVTGKPNRPVGAELRGTGIRVWRGLAPGSRRDAGYFWVGRVGAKHVVLCESAIDAVSCFQMNRQVPGAPTPGEYVCISTAGVRSHAPWLPPLLARGYAVYCGFDTDEHGEMASRHMITRHPSIQRLRPPEHDWNDALNAQKK